MAVSESWFFWSWAEAALWLALLVVALWRGHFSMMPLWFSYAIPAALFSISWAVFSTDASHVFVRPKVLEVLGSIMRAVVTGESIWRVMWAIPESRSRRWRWVAISSFGISAALLFSSRVNFTGQVRIACFVAVLTAIGLWAARYHRTVAFVRVHVLLMAIWLGSAAFASALHSLRSDYIDHVAIVVQSDCLLLWLILFSRKDLRAFIPARAVDRQQAA